jgi:hypothetical protein
MQIAKSLFSELYAVALRISLNYRLPFKIFNSKSLFYRSAFLMFSANKHRAWGDLQTPKAPKPNDRLGLSKRLYLASSLGHPICSAVRSLLGEGVLWGRLLLDCVTGRSDPTPSVRGLRAIAFFVQIDSTFTAINFRERGIFHGVGQVQ